MDNLSDLTSLMDYTEERILTFFVEYNKEECILQLGEYLSLGNKDFKIHF